MLYVEMMTQLKKTITDNILTKLGWETIDIGIEEARPLEPFAFLWITHKYFRTGNANHAFKLLQE